jgi:uncharacterized protein
MTDNAAALAVDSVSGLTREDTAEIVHALALFPAIQKAALFGSRAQGTYRRGSDVDIAVWTDEGAPSIAARLKAQLEEETKLPYFFDIVEYSAIHDEALKRAIDTQQKEIYRRSV